MSGSTVIRQLVLNDVEGCSSTLHKIERKVPLECFRPQRHAFSTVSITGVFLLFFNGQQHTHIYLKAIGQHLEAKMHKQEKRVLIFLFFEKSSGVHGVFMCLVSLLLLFPGPVSCTILG